MTVSLKDFSQDKIDRVAMIDLANDLLLEEKKAMNFHDTFETVANLKGLSKAKKAESISQFYTDLNLDGRFLTLGSNIWGLKRWYPVDQIDEEVSMTPKKKKPAKKVKENLDPGLLEDIEDEDEDEGLVEIFEDAPAFKAGTKDTEDEDEDDDKKVFSEGFGIEGGEEEEEEE